MHTINYRLVLKYTVSLFSLIILFIVVARVSANVAVATTGTTYYVATTGSDSNTCEQAKSLSTPKNTIKGGLGCIAAGNTLYIRGGTYTEAPLYNAIPSGTDWTHPVTVAAYPGETVIFKPSSGYGVIWILNKPYHHIIIDGLILDAAITGSTPLVFGQTGGVAADVTKLPHDIRIKNCEIMHGRNGGGSGNGISLSGNHVTISNCRIHDNGSDSYDHGIYIDYMGDDNVVENSEIYNNYGTGIQVYGNFGKSPNGANRNIIRNNRLHDNGDVGLTFASGAYNLAYNNIIYRNTKYVSDKAGIYNGLGASNNKIFNNTVYNNGYGIVISGTYGGSTDTIVKNNISYGNLHGNIIDSGTGTTLSNNFTTDPKFINAATNDFHLQSTSAAINAGASLSEVTTDFDGITRPIGCCYDIGAYEYGGTITTQVATPSISPNGGSYSSSQSVTLSTATTGASIYYTTNGTTPTSASTLYIGAFTVSSSATIKAVAIKSGMTNSSVASASFTITPAGPAPTVSPSSAAAVHGWLWSSNIGWVSLNCQDAHTCGSSSYGIYADANGNLSGYAWSSNSGWIRVDPQETPPRQSGARPAVINLGNGAVSGWARACSVYASGCSGSLLDDSKRGGFDGWIELAGAHHPSPFFAGNEGDTNGDGWADGGVTYYSSTAHVRGQSWGSLNFGWLNINGSLVELPLVVILSANPPSGDLNAQGQFTTTLSATVVSSGSGTGAYTYAFSCGDPLIVATPPVVTTSSLIAQSACTYVSRGKKTATVIVSRQGVKESQASVDILVKPAPPTYQEVPPK